MVEDRGHGRSDQVVDVHLEEVLDYVAKLLGWLELDLHVIHADVRRRGFLYRHLLCGCDLVHPGVGFGYVGAGC